MSRYELTSEELELLTKYRKFYEDLAFGRRQPTTAAQSHFVRVIRREAQPETEHEFAYLKEYINNRKTNPLEWTDNRPYDWD